VRWGVLRARPRLELTDVGFDDNILASSTEPVSDATATLSPALNGLLLFGSRAFFEFTERLEFTGYAENSDLSYVNQFGDARVTVPLGRFGFFGDLVLNRVNERPPDLEGVRPRRAENGLGGGIILQPGWRTQIEIGLRSLDIGYSDPADTAGGRSFNDRLGRVERRTSIGIDYRLLGRTRLTLDVDLDEIEFDSPDEDGRSKDAEGTAVLPGVDFGRRGTLSGTARLGWGRIDSVDPTRDDFSGPIGEAQLAYRPVPRGTLRLEFRRMPAFSFYSDATFLLQRTLGLRGVYYLVGPIGLEAGARIGQLTFPQSGTDRVDDLEEYLVGVRLRMSENSIGRKVEYALQLIHRRADSNIDALDRTRTTFGFGAVYGF